MQNKINYIEILNTLNLMSFSGENWVEHGCKHGWKKWFFPCILLKIYFLILHFYPNFSIKSFIFINILTRFYIFIKFPCILDPKIHIFSSPGCKIAGFLKIVNNQLIGLFHFFYLNEFFRMLKWTLLQFVLYNFLYFVVNYW